MNNGAAYIIGKRDFENDLNSTAFIILVIISILISASGFYILSDMKKNMEYSPFGPSINFNQLIDFIFMAIVFITSVFMGILSITTVTCEKQERTIDLLFYTPISEYHYIIGKFLSKFFLSLLIILITLTFFGIFSFMFSISLSIDLIKISFLSIFLISCFIAGSLFLSVLTDSASGAILIAVGLTVLLLILYSVGEFLDFLPIYDPMIEGVTGVISKLLMFTRYISPFSYFGVGRDAILSNDNIKYLISMVYSTTYSIVFLWASIILMSKKGIKE